MFIGDTEEEEKVKCIQVYLTISKELGIISEKSFVVKNKTSEDDGLKSNPEQDKDSEDESDSDF